MDTFAAPDGTLLAYHRAGDGDVLVCLPGGPMLPASNFGDLGGVPNCLVGLDPRGTGDSAVPDDPASYRAGRQVGDVEALREALGLERMTLLGHSAGGTLALLYALRHPSRVERLVLIAPSPRAIGLTITDEDRRAVALLRRGEPWFDEAFAAFERIWAGSESDEDWDAIEPFGHGVYSPELVDVARNEEAAAGYYAGGGGFDPAEVRAGLAGFDFPVVFVAGEYDVHLPPSRAAEYAALFPSATLSVIPRAGHSPWRDDRQAFRAALA